MKKSHSSILSKYEILLQYTSISEPMSTTVNTTTTSTDGELKMTEATQTHDQAHLVANQQAKSQNQSKKILMICRSKS